MVYINHNEAMKEETKRKKMQDAFMCVNTPVGWGRARVVRPRKIIPSPEAVVCTVPGPYT